MHIEWSLYVWFCRMTLSVDTNSKCGNSHELFLFLSRHNHTASHILTKNCSDIIITARNEVGARFYFHRRLWVCPRGGGCLLWGGSRGVPAPGEAWWRPSGTATSAGGTHPTGMHSCLTNKTMKGTRRFLAKMTRKQKICPLHQKYLCEDDKKWKNLSSSPQNAWTDWTDYTDNTNANRQSLPSLSSWGRILSSQLIAWWHLIVLTGKQLYWEGTAKISGY